MSTLIKYAGPLIDKPAIVFADYDGKHVMDTGTVKATQGPFRVRIDDLWYEVGQALDITDEPDHVEMFNAWLG